jgi:beta-glucosidase
MRSIFGGCSIETVVNAMTVDEKVDLVSGHGMWKTAINYRHEIPEIVMTDGTYGVRYATDQIDGTPAGGNGLDQLLAVVARRQADPVTAQFGVTRPATCFPNGSSFACSWDVDLAYELGSALAAECQSMGVNLLLGPGINIRRTPLTGRAYEYYSEDPYVSGDIAASLIRGLQDNGVGASLKHYACNNSEILRTTMNSVVDPRALREIYLKGFERAIAKGRPWTLMSSYNRLNGVQAAESEWLLDQVLRQEWGFEGCVLSDWNGIKDRAASLIAGNDLDMPENKFRKAELRGALKGGRVNLTTLDRSCSRVLKLVQLAKAGARRDVQVDFDLHHQLARRFAAQSLVLLRNQDNLLPIDPDQSTHILVVGPAAVVPVIQGSGCATTRPVRVDTPLDELRVLVDGKADVSYLPGVGNESEAEHLLAEAVAGASKVDRVIVFANTDVSYDGEGSDRVHLHLGAGQDRLIEKIAAANQNVVVVLATPDAVVMPWIEEVAAVLQCFFAGQGMGYAVASTLLGFENPSGKLTVSFPKRLEDVPSWHTYPGESGEHIYAEGLFVGYRFYDRKKIEPLFPFGFGLSYTTFSYSNLELDRVSFSEDDTISLTFDLCNEGARFGREIAQVYVRYSSTRLHRPVRELKAFAKIGLDPQETRRVTIAIPARDLMFFDPRANAWFLDEGEVTIEVGASSRDLRLAAQCCCQPTRVSREHLTLDTQLEIVLTFPGAREQLIAFLRNEAGLSETDAVVVLERAASSFLGLFNTLYWYVGDELSAEKLKATLAALSEQSSVSPPQPVSSDV